MMTSSHASGKEKVHIHSVSFNSDRSFFTVCMDEGLRVYKTNPLEIYQDLSKECGSVVRAELKDKSCVVAMASGGARPNHTSNTVTLYSCSQKSIGAEIDVKDPILNVLIRNDKLAIVMQTKIQMYDIQLYPSLQVVLSTTYHTFDNPLGLCQMSRNLADTDVICFPAIKSGCVQIVNVQQASKHQSAHGHVVAHQHELQCMVLSQSGQILATASSTGTLIRLWTTNARPHKLMEFRRGIDSAVIYDMDIGPDDLYLCCVSQKGTAHIFAIKDQNLNKTNNLSMFSKTIGYTDSHCQSSMSQFTVPHLVECRIAMVSMESVIIVTKDGRYYRYVMAPNGHPTCKMNYQVYTDLEV